MSETPFKDRLLNTLYLEETEEVNLIVGTKKEETVSRVYVFFNGCDVQLGVVLHFIIREIGWWRMLKLLLTKTGLK